MKKTCDYCVHFLFTGKRKDGLGFCREYGMSVPPDGLCDSPAREFVRFSAVHKAKRSKRKHRKESK